MTRKEFEQKSWIALHCKLPPDTEELLLAWNPLQGRPFLLEGYTLREHGKRLLELSDVEKAAEEFSEDRIFSHWKPIYGPTRRQAK